MLVDPQELYGAGVNLAARIAALAEPGQTLLSAPLREALTDDLDAEFEDLGERFLKHVAEPQRLFRVAAGSDGRPRLRAPAQALSTAFKPVLAVIPPAAQDETARAAGHALADELVASLGRHPQLRLLSLTSTASLRSIDWNAQAIGQLNPADRRAFPCSAAAATGEASACACNWT